MIIWVELFVYFVIRRYAIACNLFLPFPLASEFTVCTAVSDGQSLRHFSQSQITVRLFFFSDL
jgi:hypothetical protein